MNTKKSAGDPSSPAACSAIPDAAATQTFAIRNVLVGHCGGILTPENIEKIVGEIEHEMRHGPCAWAFSQNYNMQEKEK